MPAVLIRNISAEAHRALKQRAREKGISTEAEMRSVLESSANPEGQPKLGTALYELGRRVGGVDLDIRRDPSPGDYPEFE